MYSASDYRGMARRALKNYWWLAVGVTLLASILGGTSSSFTPSFSLTVNGDDLTQYYPEALRHALQVFLPVSGVISLVQFVIGGSVSIGHNRFCLKLVDGEQAQFEDLFSGFDIFGNAFVLNLLITLKVIAWSLLFVIPGIVAAYRYSMATYIMAENPGMQATEAIERSKALMDGRKGDLHRRAEILHGHHLIIRPMIAENPPRVKLYKPAAVRYDKGYTHPREGLHGISKRSGDRPALHDAADL